MFPTSGQSQRDAGLRPLRDAAHENAAMAQEVKAARRSQALQMKPMKRPAATMPVHKRREIMPATFALAGGAALSSQAATLR